MATGITLILLALAIVAPVGVIIGLKYARPKDRVKALIRKGMVMTFFILIGILFICNGVSEHAPALDPSTTPHKPKRALRYKTAATPLWVRTQSNSWWKWANYTAKKHTPEACMVCAEAESLFTVSPTPNNYIECMTLMKDYTARHCDAPSNA